MLGRNIHRACYTALAKSCSRTQSSSTIAVLAYQGGDLSFHGQPILAPLRQRRDHDRLDQPAHQIASLRRRFAVAAMQSLGQIAFQLAAPGSDFPIALFHF